MRCNHDSILIGLLFCNENLLVKTLQYLDITKYVLFYKRYPRTDLSNYFKCSLHLSHNLLYSIHPLKIFQLIHNVSDM